MSLLAKIKSYCETNNITAAQLSKANQRQVANALSLTIDERRRLARCWHSLRSKIKKMWEKEAEEAELVELKSVAQSWILARYPMAEFERDGDIITIYLTGKD